MINSLFFHGLFNLFPNIKTGLYLNYEFKGRNECESASKVLKNYIKGRKIVSLLLMRLIMYA